MNEQEVLVRAKQASMSIDEPQQPYESLLRRRDRKRRNQRVTAGLVGIAVFVAAVWIVKDVASLDHSGTVVVPGSTTTTAVDRGFRGRYRVRSHGNLCMGGFGLDRV